MDIKLELIDTRQNNRQKFTGIDDLALSIAKHGLIQPITVKPANDGRYTLLAGERRYMAHLWLQSNGHNVNTISANVLDVTDNESYLITLLENDNRVQTNDIEQGVGYHRAMTDYGMSMANLARAIGKRKDYIERRISLLSLRDDIQKLVADGQLSIGYAVAMIELDHNRQFIALTALRDYPNGSPSLTWFRNVTAELLTQQGQMSMSFGLFGDGSDMVIPSIAKVTLPDNPKHYRPSFNPLNMTDDIKQQLDHWRQNMDQWNNLGKPNMVDQCETVVTMLEAMLSAMPAIVASDNPADRIYRVLLERGSMTTRQVYQYCNIDKTQWGSIKFSLLTSGRIVETKAGRGYRYNAA